MTNYTNREYIEGTAIFIVMTVVYIFIINPILLDVVPILAFQSSEGFERHPGGLGQLSYLATIVAGVFIYYLVIRIVIEEGVIALFAFYLLILLIFIPNRFLPAEYHPGTITERDIEERISDSVYMNGNN